LRIFEELKQTQKSCERARKRFLLFDALYQTKVKTQFLNPEQGKFSLEKPASRLQ